MRNINVDLANNLQEQVINVAILAQLQFDSATVYMWTGVGDLVWNSNTYVGGGNLIGISTVEETQELQAKGLQVSLNGISSSLISLAFNERARGRPFRMWLACLDSAGAIIGTPYRLFTGMMDVISSFDNGATANISLSVENSLIIGQRSKTARYTSLDQKKIYPLDTGFDKVNQLQDKEIIW